MVGCEVGLIDLKRNCTGLEKCVAKYAIRSCRPVEVSHPFLKIPRLKSIRVQPATNLATVSPITISRSWPCPPPPCSFPPALVRARPDAPAPRPCGPGSLARPLAGSIGLPCRANCLAASYDSLSVVYATIKTLSYRITLKREPEGVYTVLVPALPGCVTYGKTVEEAIEMSRDAITGYVESLIEDSEPVPVEDDLIECRVTVEAHA
jgi:antitoxin HicB